MLVAQSATQACLICYVQKLLYKGFANIEKNLARFYEETSSKRLYIYILQE